jgi:tetratricopeptide (TPR) repeat protein
MKSRQHWPRSLAIAATLLAACIVGGAGLAWLAVRAAEPPPIAIIGVDGADWQTIDPLIAAGRLPAFAMLKAAGGVGTMRPEPPLLSPIIWTTIATGRRPEDHGVLDFMVDQPGGGQMPVSGGARRTKALWEIFSEAGRPVLISGWWATWPPDRVRGVIVSDRVAVPHMRLDTNGTNDAVLVHPAERLRDVAAARAATETIGYAALNEFVPLTRKEFDEAAASDKSDGTGAGLYRNRYAHTRASLAAARTYGAATTKLLPAVRPAFIAVYFDLVDTVSHLFSADPQRRERAIASAYSEIDQQIRAIARALEPNTFVIVMSDHGFYRADAGIPDDPSDLTSGAAAWHRPYGIVAATTAAALAGTSAAPKLAPLGAVSPLDIAPSVLARADLAVASDMPGRILNTLTGGARVTTIASYGAHQLPEQTFGDGRDNLVRTTELERLRALGYVSGRSAVTTLARVNLGEILFRKGAIKEAIVQLEAAVAADRLNQRAGLWLARAYASANRPEDAVRLYDRLLQAPAGGTTVDPLIVLAATDLDIARGQRAGAADRLARLPATLLRQPETTVARGALAEADRKPLEAERLFRAAYSAQPTNIDALSRLVDLLIRGGRGAAAAQAAGEAARRFPDSPERIALAGEAALAERRIADAARAFRQALVLAPDAASLRVELGRAELLQNDADAALKAIDEVAGHDADVLRGAAFSIEGNWPAAVLAYTRAAGEGAPSSDLLNALGNAQLEAGRAADAVATLERSLSLKADQPAIRALADRARAQAPAARPR